MNKQEFEEFITLLKNNWVNDNNDDYLTQFYLSINEEIPVRKLLLEYALNLIGKHRLTKDFMFFLNDIITSKEFRPYTLNNLVNEKSIEDMIKGISSKNMSDSFTSILENKIKEIINDKLEKSSKIDIFKNKKINHIASLFDLSETEVKILLFTYCVAIYEPLETLCNRHNKSDTIKLLAYSINVSLDKVGKLLNEKSKLVTSGLVELYRAHYGGLFSISDKIVFFFSGLTDFESSILESMNDKEEVFSIDSFPVNKNQIEILRFLLCSDKPARILIYGFPGVGKTEFAKSLVRYTGRKAFFFKDEIKDQYRSNRKLNCIVSLNAAVSMLKNLDSVLIIDEADDILNTENLFLKSDSAIDKGILNRLLDTIYGKTIWIVNNINFIDPSVKRRFDYSLQFEKSNSSMRRKIWKSALEKTELINFFDDAKIKLFSKKYPLDIAEIKSTVDFLDMIIKKQNMQNDKLNGFIEEVLNGRMKLYSNGRFGKNISIPGKADNNFAIELLNLGDSYNRMLEILDNYFLRASGRVSERAASKAPIISKGLRMLFWGIPGTGKTAFAKYIAEKYDREIIIKRASDILDMFVGGTEKNIRSMFREAERNNAILLIDEIDSILQRRENHLYSWEVSRVNELLTGMEDFTGVSIFTTNQVDLLDRAIIRRFHVKVEFRPLSVSKINKALKYYFPEIILNRNDFSYLSNTDCITIGDIKNVYDKIALLKKKDIDKQTVIKLLNEEIRYKDEYRNRNIGFIDNYMLE